MFNSNILDVAIGLMFCFLAVSLVASTVLEAISSTLNWRAKNLKEGVGKLVNDPDFLGLAKSLYEHAAINPLMVSRATVKPAPAGIQQAVPGAVPPLVEPADPAPAQAIAPDAAGRSRVPAWVNRILVKLGLRDPAGAVSSPAYIQTEHFATALLDVTGLSTAGSAAYADEGTRLAGMLAALQASPLLRNQQLAEFLEGIVRRTKGDLATIEGQVGAWFDNGMDRLSGVYKRRTQWVSFLTALVLAVMLNIDAVRIARVLWEQPTLAANLKIPPDVAAAAGAGLAGGASAQSDQLAADERAAKSALDMLDGHLPVGWGQDRATWTGLDYAGMPIGWLITAFATLFGAPFWYDALQSIVRLKGSGPSPTDKKSDRAAAT